MVDASITIYSAQWVLPMETTPIADGVVVVVGHRIAFVGPSAALPEGFAGARRVDLGAAALLPGLINAHTHLELTAMRGFLEGLAFRDWLSTLTRARRDCFDDASLFDSSCAGIEEGLRHGVTTFADTTESGAPLAAMRAMGVRGIGYLEVFGPDPRRANDMWTEFLPRLSALRELDTPLVQAGLSPHSPYTVSVDLFRVVADYARAERLPLAVHIAESVAESRFVKDGEGPFADGLRARNIPVLPRGQSPIALLDDCGILACDPLLIHAIHIDGDDIARISARGARVVHCPISNLKLAHGIAPLADLRAAGVATGLGTDSVASNDRMDMLGEARQAALLMALRCGVPDALSAHEALRLATGEGARALGIDDRVGALRVGLEADLAAFPLDHPDHQPVHDPAVTLVHVLAGAARASLVVVAGVERVRDGMVINTDHARHARVAALGARLKAWREAQFPS